MKYLLLNCLFSLTLLAVWGGLRRVKRVPLLGAMAIVLLLTAVFDPIIIALGIVDYNADAILGFTIFGAPIEDFFYALYAVGITAALWEKIGGENGNH